MKGKSPPKCNAYEIYMKDPCLGSRRPVTVLERDYKVKTDRKRIAETFGKDGTVAVFFFEMLGKFAQGEADASGGEVGLAA
jgi:hypothetical protein